MKVILLQNVRGTGKAGDIKNVSDGYAMNMLLPRKLAMPATDQNIKRHQSGIQKREVGKNISRDLFEKTIGDLGGQEFVFTAKTNEQDHLYAAITAKDIAAKIKESKGINLDPEFIHTDGLKEIGEFQIKIGDKDLEKEISIKIESE